MAWWNPLSWLDPTQGAANEAQVAAFVAKVKQDVAQAEAEAEAVYAWIGANGPQEIAEINSILQVVLSVVSVTDPRVAAAVAAVNAFTTALNTVVAAKNAGESITQALVDVYKKFKTMQAASASAVVSTL